MPQVGKKKFSYSKKGRTKAKAYAKRTGTPVHTLPNRTQLQIGWRDGIRGINVTRRVEVVDDRYVGRPLICLKQLGIVAAAALCAGDKRKISIADEVIEQGRCRGSERVELFAVDSLLIDGIKPQSVSKTTFVFNQKGGLAPQRFTVEVLVGHVYPSNPMADISEQSQHAVGLILLTQVIPVAIAVSALDYQFELILIAEQRVASLLFFQVQPELRVAAVGFFKPEITPGTEAG